MHKPFRKIRVKDADLSAVQDNIINTLNPLTKVLISDGQLITGIQVGTSPTKISHTLQRKPLGWVVVDQTAAANSIHRSAEFTDTTLTLTASSTTTISLWVF